MPAVFVEVGVMGRKDWHFAVHSLDHVVVLSSFDKPVCFCCCLRSFIRVVLLPVIQYDFTHAQNGREEIKKSEGEDKD